MLIWMQRWFGIEELWTGLISRDETCCWNLTVHNDRRHGFKNSPNHLGHTRSRVCWRAPRHPPRKQGSTLWLRSCRGCIRWCWCASMTPVSLRNSPWGWMTLLEVSLFVFIMYSCSLALVMVFSIFVLTKCYWNDVFMAYLFFPFWEKWLNVFTVYKSFGQDQQSREFSLRHVSLRAKKNVDWRRKRSR